MSVVVKQKSALPTEFKPEAAREGDARADAVIEYAKKVHDWPTLETAVEKKIEDQTEFIRWWTDSVRRAGNQPKNADPGYLSVQDAEELTGITQQQVSKWRKKLKEPNKYKMQLYGVAWKKAMMEAADNHRAQGTGENEWYTPEQYLIAARDVMGGIDLDPASSEAAQQIVSAKAFFTEKDNGLELDWYGNVWLNPPYSQPLISQFIHKLATEFGAGNIEQAIVLTHNYTDTGWFHEMMEMACAVCFTRGRIKFYNAEGEVAAPTQGQAFSYFGQNTEEFAETFRQFGFVVKVTA